MESYFHLLQWYGIENIRKRELIFPGLVMKDTIQILGRDNNILNISMKIQKMFLTTQSNEKSFKKYDYIALIFSLFKVQ